ncbi:hypothetical protein [Thermoactinomyces sp. DSM 45892]|uniref:hypothetical protein n=1 Tax=Thermoactinomyces sp. DSM 45892 TaxID=1882753 RepID=UPI000897BD5E|nr:hypothetical protein [Thermoactinomyces sp. DSM 45892]SDX93413.1 hypothetical protein SAMN05444416_10144 [Thermoactinomyces sp. DSM 45892]
MDYLEMKGLIRRLDYIFDIHFYTEMPYQGLHDPETTPIVDLKGLFLEENKTYEAHIRFIGVEGLYIDRLWHGNSPTLDLIDREEEGWEQKYELDDVEGDIRLYCDEVEVISVKESEILIEKEKGIIDTER